MTLGRRSVAGAYAMVLVLCAECPAAAQSIADLTRRSHYVFSGKVERLGASNVGLLKASPSTAVVQLREVLRGSKTLDLVGRSVTVQLRRPNEVKVSDELIFFTDVMYYGENLALHELGNVPARDVAGVRKQIKAALAAQADDELRQRLAGAQLVVVGTVGRIAPAKTKRHPISFHDPQLAQATIKVEETLKGKSGNEVIVFFPRAADPFWSRAPHLKEGESGVFLLRPNPNKRLPTGGLTALDPLDVQPRSALDRVKRLLSK